MIQIILILVVVVLSNNNNNNGIATAFTTTTTVIPKSLFLSKKDCSSSLTRQRRRKGVRSITSISQLCMATTTTKTLSENNPISSSSDNNNSNNSNTIYWNGRYVFRLLFNQILLGYSIWFGGIGMQVLVKEADFSNISSYVQGIIGVIPLLLFSYYIVETSESPSVANLNVSTNRIVMELLGTQRYQPIIAFGTSLALASITGLVEEVIFRGEVLPYLGQWSIDQEWATKGSADAILYGTVLSTLLFAALHINPIGIVLPLFQQVRNNSNSSEIKALYVDIVVIFGFQCVTGMTFALLFILTGGNLAVPIIAHALYDFYTFYKTHYVVTTQMEYAIAQQQQQERNNNDNNNSILGFLPFFSKSVERRWSTAYGTDFVRDVRNSFYYYMDTDRDGVVSRKELRIALNSYYDINLTKEESQEYLRILDTNDNNEIDYTNFLNYIGNKERKRRRIRGWNSNNNDGINNTYTSIQKAFQEEEEEELVSPFAIFQF